MKVYVVTICENYEVVVDSVFIDRKKAEDYAYEKYGIGLIHEKELIE